VVDVPTLIVPAPLDTCELTLRPLRLGDVDALQRMIDDPVIRDAMLWDNGSERSAQRFIEAAIGSDALPVREQYSFGIAMGKGDDLAGVVTVKLGMKPVLVFPLIIQAELEIFLAPEQRRQGWGRRVLTVVRDWCLDELEASAFGAVSEVVAVCLPNNAGSRALLGAVLDERGPVQSPRRTGGQTVDAVSFGMTRAERDLRWC
jgi:RimJ/RimL family protein N-acetyltransferase